MNKEELKELIRKELEEALFAHPSKLRGKFPHPGSQPHVKDYKKNKKKKTREGAINERKIEYSEADLKNLAGYTDRNQHLEARSFIAQSGNYKRLHKAYEALITIRDVMGHTPKGAEQIRQDLDKNLKNIISKDIKNWEEVWGSL
tara:strand:+ start:3366 stop:3800 length:435 start_codon:yes stop_codon:yes gene_type:complete